MKIHFIGIGGIGVSGLSQYYLAKGHQITGSDLVRSEITDLLKKKGAKIFTPHQSKLGGGQVGKHKLPDLVIYSPAIPEDNPELKEARRLEIKCQTYPEALGELTKQYFTIAVCGTHGKSTTTAMIALILIKAGLNPTVILGTKLKEFGNSNFRPGGISSFKFQVPSSKILIIEADEWQASFLKYFPKIIVLTTIEREHLDYYKNLNHILKTYKEFIGHLPRNGILIVNKDDKNISKLTTHNSQLTTQKYSLSQNDSKKLKKILKVPGEHNISNALAALTTARVLKIPDEISFKALSEYKGAWRRFEIIHKKQITIISDYAHHPTEIKATITACREKFPNEKIWLVFQPHQYQRTYYLFNDFVKTFQQALQKKWINLLIVTDIYDVAGRERKKIKEKVNSKKMIKTINKKSAIYPVRGQGVSAKAQSKQTSNGVYLPKEKILKYLKKNLKDGEVVIIMGAGDIYQLTNEFSTKNKKTP